MKKLKLTSSHYRELLKNYQTHLETLNYPLDTITSFTSHVKEFLHHLSTQYSFITDLHPSYQNQYLNHLNTRQNQTRGGGLATNTINKHKVAINNFMTYLLSHNRNLETLHFKTEEVASHPTVLTEQEIKELYQVSYEWGYVGSYHYGQRDRAILAIYYGCGLRLSEGVSLNLSDIDQTNHLLKVRKGKGGKTREVPIVSKCLEHLTTYIEESREWYTYSHGTNTLHQKKPNTDGEALLLNQKGRRLGKSSIYRTLHRLKERTTIDKSFSTHSLRHSIATHLLTAGMELDRIQEFLGHSTLESTQIYTHLAYGNEELQDMAV